jgi:hypothetical protein
MKRHFRAHVTLNPPAGFKNDVEHEDSKRWRVHKNSEGLSTLINSICQSGKINNLIATLR